MSYYQGNQQQQQQGNWQQQQQQPQGSFQQGYGDPNGWQQQQQPQYGQQQQQQQQPQYGHQQQQPGYPTQQQQPQQQPFWNPAAAAGLAMAAASSMNGGAGGGGMMGMNGIPSGDMLNIAGQAGKNFLANSSWAKNIPGLEATMQALRKYFAVDNAYVLAKMKRVLVPVLAKTWIRQRKDMPPNPDGTIAPLGYELPVHDDCAPDLYLPIMSGITYVLLSALLYGTAGVFNPEVIPTVTTKCLLVQSLEVAAFRAGFYSLQTPVAILDLFSYTGYKYLGLCVNMCVGIVAGHLGFGTTGFYLTFLWTASAMAYFMLKTMSNNIPVGMAGRNDAQRGGLVVGFALSQFAAMWFVSQTKFL